MIESKHNVAKSYDELCQQLELTNTKVNKEVQAIKEIICNQSRVIYEMNR